MTSPAASRAAIQQDGWHDPKLPPHGLLPFAFAGLSEHAREAAREYAEIYARTALEAAQPASPAPLTWTDKEIEAAARSRGCKWHSDGYWVFEDADLHPFVRSLLALASPQVAPETDPRGPSYRKGWGISATSWEQDGYRIEIKCRDEGVFLPAIDVEMNRIAPAPVAPTPARPSEDARDAARYRAWRNASLTLNPYFLICLVKYMDGRANSGNLPSAEEVDAAMDAAMAAVEPTQGEQSQD
jgi:hypothetical protein